MHRVPVSRVRHHSFWSPPVCPGVSRVWDPTHKSREGGSPGSRDKRGWGTSGTRSRDTRLRLPFDRVGIRSATRQWYTVCNKGHGVRSTRHRFHVWQEVYSIQSLLTVLQEFGPSKRNRDVRGCPSIPFPRTFSLFPTDCSSIEVDLSWGRGVVDVPPCVSTEGTRLPRIT